MFYVTILLENGGRAVLFFLNPPNKRSLKQENSSHVILFEAYPEEPLYYLKDFPV